MPHADLFVAGHFYGKGAPVFFTREQAKAASFKLKVVADISCDIDGPVACTIRPSTIENPIYGYDAQSESEVDFMNTNAIAVMAVDNLPCELPKDASEGFGEIFVKNIIPSFFNADAFGVLERSRMTQNGQVLAMLFVGGMVPVVFSALAMNAVGKAAMEMVNEVVRQFKEIPGIMEGTGKPEYDKCVDISTKASLKEMMLPGLLTIGFPILVVLVGKLVYQDNNMLVAEMLGGYMAGVTVSGVLWAIFQNNAGGAWDNAKKSFEAGVEINGVMTYKGSEAHKAAVTGDTVGDPFKDTSGPSMNILIKLTCLIGLVIAPILGGHSSEEAHASQDVNVEVLYTNSADLAEATISQTTVVNGTKVVVEKSITGTEQEIEEAVEGLLNETTEN